MRIAIVIGSIRDGRNSKSIGDWVAARAAERTDAEFVTVDLKEFDLPLMASATLPAMADRKYRIGQRDPLEPGHRQLRRVRVRHSGYNHGVPWRTEERRRQPRARNGRARHRFRLLRSGRRDPVGGAVASDRCQFPDARCPCPGVHLGVRRVRTDGFAPRPRAGPPNCPRCSTNWCR